MFSLMGHNFFGDQKQIYSASSYFYRVEFQQRGAPHIHSLLWLRDKKNKEAPNFWVEPNNLDKDDGDEYQSVEVDPNAKMGNKMKEIEKFADLLITTSPDDIACEQHEFMKNQVHCEECNILKSKVEKFQKHSHTFTCAKKGKTITIKDNEGHGRLDGTIKGPELKNIPVCRFKIPRFPLDETKLVLAISKDIEESDIKERKKDLSKIIKFLIRQTYSGNQVGETDSWKK